jgi:tRNA pseudouridine55 synthase
MHEPGRKTHERQTQPDQVLAVRKPVGWTSFDVIRWIKSRLPGVKVGHAGTLDPFAEGVLVVCIGRATKRVSEFLQASKSYRACIRLGVATDTLDITGSITDTITDITPDRNRMLEALAGFIGDIDQVPPQFSALRINGKRAYHLARAGRPVEMKKRKVTIHRLDLVSIDSDLLTIDIECSKGTYVRSLARDVARAMGTVGYVQTLVRTAIGQLSLDNALEIEELTPVLIG